jgi:hypothetical protein
VETAKKARKAYNVREDSLLHAHVDGKGIAGVAGVMGDVPRGWVRIGKRVSGTRLILVGRRCFCPRSSRAYRRVGGNIQSGLVTVDEESNIIRLVHYTKQEYFERTQREWLPYAETDIAKICVTYLPFDAFECGFCQSDEEFETRLQSNSLYDYAARNWGHHIRESDAQCLNAAFVRSEAKASACSQAMMVSLECRYHDYSQRVPKQMKGLHLAAWFGLTEMVGRLIKDGHDPDCKDSYGRTPLSRAAAYGHEAVVRLLVARADVEADFKDDSSG